MSKNLILLVGAPGSGKSTLAKSLEQEGYFRISQDDSGKEHLILFQAAIHAGKNIIIDRLNFNKEQRERYLKPAREAGYSTKIIVLHVPSQVCFDRCLERKEHPTIKTMKDASSAVNMFFSKYERVEDNEADVVERLGWDGENKVDAIICDLDGTLCNIDHRLHFVQDGPADSVEKQKKSWPKFFAGIKDDKVNGWCKSILDNFYDTHQIILCSGRPDDHQEATVDWLEDNGICYDKLFMRRRGDYRKDEIVKQIILDFELKTQYNILFCVDGRYYAR